ncbi:MAG: IgGFc-binding protein [Myxococcota bacterium]
MTPVARPVVGRYPADRARRPANAAAAAALVRGTLGPMTLQARPRWTTVAWLIVALSCGEDSSPQPAAGSSSTTDAEPASTGPATPPPATDGSTSTRGLDSSTATTVAPDLPSFDVGGKDLDSLNPVCSNDLTQILDANTGVVLETCPPAQGCFEGECIAACQAAAAAEGSVGCEFFVPTPPFYANSNPDAVQSGPCHALLVANPWSRDAIVELERDGTSYDVDLVTYVPSGLGAATVYDPLPATGIPSGQVAVVFLSHRSGVHNGTSLECPRAPALFEDAAPHGTATGLAFELRSDTPLQVYDILPYGGALSYLPSASLLYPTSAWGQGYAAVTPHEPDGRQWVQVVGLDDGTTVDFQPSVPIWAGNIPNAPAGLVTSYSIDAGEVLQWHGAGDLSGSIISADAPVGLWSGNTYLLVDTQDMPESGHDSAHQMIPDVNALGSEYVGAGLYSRLPGLAAESVRYRVVGVVDGTALQWDPAPPPGAPLSVDAGDVFEFESREVFSVRSTGRDRPFSLSQYMSGTLSGQPGCLGEPGNCALGDEDWVVLVPPAQFLSSYSFFVDPTYATGTLVLVRVAGPRGFSDVDVQCMGVVGDWEPVGTDGRFEVARVELYRGGVASVPGCATSQHSAISERGFGVMVWGTDLAASYGYAAGGTARAINVVDVDPTP